MNPLLGALIGGVVGVAITALVKALRRNRHRHTFGNWTEPVETTARDDFRTTVTLNQRRICTECKLVETRRQVLASSRGD